MNSECRERIREKAGEIGYRPVSLNCSGTDLYAVDGIYCYSMTKKSTNQAVFRVITQVDMNFPIIEKIMGFRFFQVAGDTKTVELQFGE